MTPTNRRPVRSELNNASLNELALAYVARYATTRGKLRIYLSRKVRERGWSEEQAPDLDQLANRFAELGYVDDAAYALAKARTLSARGYGKRRVSHELSMSGITDEDRAEAEACADASSVEAALRYARRRRLGPFASAPADEKQRQKWIAAIVRAGHSYGIARAITSLVPGARVDLEALQEALHGPGI